MKIPVWSGAGRLVVLLALLALLALPAAAHAQRYELGVQVTTLRQDAIGEGAAGVGARFHLNLGDFIAADAEISHFPENPSGNYGETTVVAGVRAGIRRRRFGVFAKVRPGLVHYGGAYFDLRLPDRTYPLLNVGGIFEYYASERFFVRVEAGDTMIAFGGVDILSAVPPPRLDTTHNLQTALGLGWRF